MTRRRKFNFFNGSGIAKSLSYYSFRVVFAIQKLSVFQLAAIRFLPPQGQNKQRVCSVLTPLNIAHYILTLYENLDN